MSLLSCRTYYDKLFAYHKELNDNKFEEAENGLRKNKFLKNKRNEILKYLELGKVFHLQHQYDSSNVYFNKVELLMEGRSVAADISKSVLVNEAITRYKGQDFERVLVNYYKALNYLYLNLNEDALVEAKRINLRLNELSDKQIMDGKKYKADAFAHTLQAFIYERMNDHNNAFIAYRNAVELYEKSSSLEFMGSNLPMQLKIDLINSANKADMFAEREEYCKKFNLQFNDIKDTAKHELLFIWENGLSPIKQQQDVFLYMVKGVGGDLMFSDKSGTINIPFPLPDKHKDKSTDLSDLNIVRVAYPTYVDIPLFFSNLSIQYNGKTFTPEIIENVAYIARENLREDFVKEMTLTVSRIALKKLAEAELKKENEAAGAVLGIANALVEKADTRNWQSLPSFISYTRIPLSKGEIKLNLQFYTVANQTITDSLTVNVKNRLEIINYTTLQHLPPVLKNR